MSEPNSPSDPTPAVPPAPVVPPAPSFTYGSPADPAAPAAPQQPAAPVAPAYGVPAYGAPVYGAAPGVAPRRTWDLVLTIILLAVGLIFMIIGVVYGLIFLNPQLLVQTLAQSGYGVPTINPTGPGVVIIISHLVLYAIAAGVGIFLLIKKKIAFWVPLAAGVIATIVFWAMAVQVFASIPGFIQ